MPALLALLRTVPPLAWALALALAWGGWQRHLAITAVQALADAKESAYRTALIETTRRLSAQQEITNAADRDLASARSAAAAARGAADRLRLAAAAAAGRACDPAPAGPGAPASAAAGVLADVLGECGARLVQMAGAADASRIAGLACERSYDTLTGR